MDSFVVTLFQTTTCAYASAKEKCDKIINIFSDICAHSRHSFFKSVVLWVFPVFFVIWWSLFSRESIHYHSNNVEVVSPMHYPGEVGPTSTTTTQYSVVIMDLCHVILSEIVCSRSKMHASLLSQSRLPSFSSFPYGLKYTKNVSLEFFNFGIFHLSGNTV